MSRRRKRRKRRKTCLRISDEYLFYIYQITTISELLAKLQAIFKSKVALALSTFARNSCRHLLKMVLTWRNMSVSYTDCVSN